jgi:squalene synthase HpnC
MSFEDDLRRFGPEAPVAVSRDEALAYCARLTASHYENFSVVSWLTPREHRPAFQSIYAFCRWSDDLGDEVGDPQRSLRLLDWWRDELRAMYQGRARHPVMRALEETVARYGIPIEPFEALIDAFVQDQSVTEYLTYPQLLDYCTRSANPVGHLVLYVAGAYNEENASLSDATCTALQLANFWQDVARDLAIGRIYLPREDRQRFGYPESDLRALRFTRPFAELMKFEVERTRGLFEEGRALVARIPGVLAVDIDLFSRGGLSILDRIEAGGLDVLTARPVLSRWTKIGLLCRALAGLAAARLRGESGRSRESPASDSHETVLASASTAPPRRLESPR